MDFVLYYGFLALVWALVVYFFFDKNEDKQKKFNDAARGFLIFFVFSMILHFWGMTGWLIGFIIFMVILTIEAFIETWRQRTK